MKIEYIRYYGLNDEFRSNGEEIYEYPKGVMSEVDDLQDMKINLKSIYDY